MKIADFFIALGFDIKGERGVDETTKSVEKLEFSSVKLLGVVTALNAAFYAMITRGVEVGVALQRFALMTGQSTDELQRWQQASVRGNASARTFVDAIGAIQKARAAIAFGNSEAAAPWMLLGIDPRQDPFKVLEQLRQAVLRLDPAIARQKLGEMGFGDDILFLLKQRDFGRGNTPREFLVTPEEQARLAHLGGVFKEFLWVVGQVGARLAAQFAEPLAAVLTQLTRGLTLLGKFADWLEKGSAVATAFKYAVLGVMTVLAGLQVALGLLLLGPLGEIIAVFALIGVALAGLVLLIQDFWVATRGGKSLFDWNEGLLLTVKNVERLAHAIEWFIETWDNAVAKIKAGQGAWGWATDILGAAGGATGTGNLIGRIALQQASGGSSTQTNNIDVHVAPGPDAHATGREVGRGAQRQIMDAWGQMPAPGR